MGHRLSELAGWNRFPNPERRYDVHAISSDASTVCVDASDFCVVFEDGRDLVFTGDERRANEGIAFACPVTTSRSGGELIVSLVCGNIVRIDVASRGATPPPPPAPGPRAGRRRECPRGPGALPSDSLEALARFLVPSDRFFEGRPVRTPGDPRPYRTFALYADGSYDELDAIGFCVDLLDGFYLGIQCFERAGRAGIQVSTGLREEDPRGWLHFSPGASNVCYVGVQR